MEKRLLTVSEVAHYLGFSRSTIRKWIRSGLIPFHRLNGGIRFDIKTIDSWVQKKKENVPYNPI